MSEYTGNYVGIMDSKCGEMVRSFITVDRRECEREAHVGYDHFDRPLHGAETT